jgi:hypothetical protein
MGLIGWTYARWKGAPSHVEVPAGEPYLWMDIFAEFVELSCRGSCEGTQSCNERCAGPAASLSKNPMDVIFDSADRDA